MRTAITRTQPRTRAENAERRIAQQEGDSTMEPRGQPSSAVAGDDDHVAARLQAANNRLLRASYLLDAALDSSTQGGRTTSVSPAVIRNVVR